MEGGDDDDIFSARPPDHSRKVWECVRNCVKDRKQKRKEVRDAEKTRKILEKEEWYSDGEKEELREDQFEWGESVDMQSYELASGHRFPDRKIFQKVLKDWSVRKGYDLKYPKCEAKVITAVCKGGCEWRMRQSVIQNSSTFQVKTLMGEHKCSFRTDNHQADYKYLGERILEAVRDNPNGTLDALKNKIKSECGIEVSMHKVYRATMHALSLLTTDIRLQIKRLYDYCATVEKYNPRSSMVLKVERSLTTPKLHLPASTHPIFV
ncbi:unnamed protein product [Cuscuta europaea]|uniref:Transposase MuDR plant domain-containing protein n=1 Tax=Cuscuta europaea TaxID=41803 RepID=A0A9P0Z2Z4_CUSEU|nr:unnamed protein product [Cuscuta europaea]CAH9087226.1 unnamed protein product [Cuscuta europaea]CAH9087228.1 unnamed protein product [Cuscuta europaea]CAH9087230.1 unnamed protein product [Cuscuta europaea]